MGFLPFQMLRTDHTVSIIEQIQIKNLGIFWDVCGDSACRLINDSGATCLIIGLGAPKQEIWITQYRHAMPKVKVYMGVGATIDYEAGAVKRAPRWMTRIGLEWLYRITTEPLRYWRRYLRDMEYFWLLLLDGLGLYKSPMQPGTPAASTKV